MLINPIVLSENDNRTFISSVIQYSGKEEKLWYSVDKKYGQYLTSQKLDGLLVAVLPLAMELGEDITVKGTISEKLYHNLTNYHMKIVQLAVPSIKSVKIIPDSLDDGQKINCKGAVGAGFSGGIDSYYTVLHYLLNDDVLPKYKITHLMFSNVGTHGSGSAGSKLFRSRYELIRGFPEEVGVDFIDVDSNVNDILTSTINTDAMRTLCLTMRYLSCPLLLQSLFNKYYYSSNYSYEDLMTANFEESTSYTDALAIHLLSTETLEFILSGAQYTRVEKTRLLSLSSVPKHYLNVCNDPTGPREGKNCSVCYKCCRTLFTLELLGAIDQFSEVFDLNKYMQVRNRYIIRQVLGKSGDSLAGEIKEYAASIGYSFPVWQRVLAWIFKFKPIHYLAKKVYEFRRI